MEEDIKKINDYIHDWYDNSTDEDGYDRHIIDEDDKNFINAIENILNRLQEDEAVIDLMAKEINGKTLTKEQWCKLLNRTSNCGYDDTCLKCLKEHFRKKVKDEVK